MASEKALNVVRDDGLLDRYLAAQRHRLARTKLQTVQHKERLLDIGCGNYPLFLKETDFKQKYGIDKNINAEAQKYAEQHGVKISEHDLKKPDTLPFDSNFFDAVTMLAVFEHIEPRQLVPLLTEIKRILKPSGVYVITTPAFWTDKLLRFLAFIRLISAEEIKDHKGAYTPGNVRGYFLKAGFENEKIETGYFELLMNMWVSAKK